MGPTQIHLKALQVRLIGNQGLVSNNFGEFVPSVSKGCGRDAFLKFNLEMDLGRPHLKHSLPVLGVLVVDMCLKRLASPNQCLGISLTQIHL